MTTTIRLNDGVEIPHIGFGTFPHDGEDSAEPTRHAIEAGYRLIDTALRYENERGVGEGMRSSGVPRDDIIVTSKLPGRHHGRDEARVAVRESLERLGLERIDLYLIHWPLPRLDRYVDTWKTLIELRDEGLLRSIGVSNFTPAHLDRLVTETGVVPAVNQIEMHPYFPQVDQRRFHDELGIVTESWSPLGRGGGVLSEPVVLRAAGAHGVTPAQVVLRWHVQLGTVPIPKSRSIERQRENRAIEGFTLSDQEVASVTALGRPDGRIAGQDPDVYEEF